MTQLQKYIKDTNVVLRGQHLFCVKSAIPGNPASYSFPLGRLTSVLNEITINLISHIHNDMTDENH